MHNTQSKDQTNQNAKTQTLEDANSHNKNISWLCARRRKETAPVNPEHSDPRQITLDVKGGGQHLCYLLVSHFYVLLFHGFETGMCKFALGVVLFLLWHYYEDSMSVMSVSSQS